MFLVTIIPIARGISKETLTYFSSIAPYPGSVVQIPLRSRKISGIVVSVENAQQKKSEIKTLAYGIKKIDTISSRDFLLPEFIDSAKVLADYYASTTGAVLSILIPKTILEDIIETKTKSKKISKEPSANQPSTEKGYEILILQSGDEERKSTYKSLVREEFAKKKSVFLCLPSREEIRIVGESLQKGIEQYTYILHAGLSKQELSTTWQEILTVPHPILIIATGYFLSIPRKDISTIIVENESSRAYSQPARPYMDMRTVCELLSKHMGWRVIFGDSALRTETLFRQKEHEIAEASPLKFRVVASVECRLSDVRTPKDQIKKEFEIIGNELGSLVGEAKESNSNIFLFCARKGLSPITVCSDCGDTVSCNNCGGPVTLYGSKNSKEGNFFLCHKCGERRSASELCKRCGSWKLTPLGIGIESTARELSKKFPQSTLFVMDKDHVKTQKQAETLIKKFYSTPGSICLGTELALPYLQERIGLAGVVSLDSYFGIPDWRIHEKILHIILSLRSITDKKLIVQTRRPDEKIFEYALKGNLADFYRDEIEERKRFGYPPFNTFIKISLSGAKAAVRERMQQIKKELLELSADPTKPYLLNIFEAFHPGSSEKYTVHGLLMLPRGSWPDPILLAKLRSLSPAFSIKIDPDSLL